MMTINDFRKVVCKAFVKPPVQLLRMHAQFSIVTVLHSVRKIF